MAVEITSVSWFTRIRQSLKGILFGFILMAAAVVLLFWNEGRAVKRARDLSTGAQMVVTTPASPVDTSREGQLVHVTGRAFTEDPVEDAQFGVKLTDTLRLVRQVEMYQWVENQRTREEKKLGGGTRRITEYTYAQQWSAHPQDSSKFHETGHANPAMPYRGGSWTPTRVHLGDYRLSDSLLAMIEDEEPLALAGELEAKVKQALGSGRPISRSGEWVYLAAGTASPQVGDVRVRWQVVKPTVVSVVAQQAGDTFRPQPMDYGTIELLQVGEHSKEAMFQQAQSENSTLAWLLRGGGLLAMIIGISLILHPLRVLADVVPALGSLAGGVILLIAVPLGLVLTLTVIALGWIWYRPLLGISLLVAAAVPAVLLYVRARKAKARPPALAAAGPAPVAVGAVSAPPPLGNDGDSPSAPPPLG